MWPVLLAACLSAFSWALWIFPAFSPWFSTHPLRIPDLVSLSIAYNPEVGVAMQEFVASWSLKELDASGTGLCQVPAALAQSVRTLKLADNWLKVSQ